MKVIATVLALIIITGAIVVAGWWGLIFGIILALSCGILVASSLSILELRGADFLVGIVLFLSLSGILWVWWNKNHNTQNQASTEVPTSAPAPAPTSPPQARTPAQCQGPWSWRIVEPPAREYLCWGWKTDNPTGRFTITTPSGRVVHDGPGMVNHLGYQPDGWYEFETEGSKLAVEVYNRW